MNPIKKWLAKRMIRKIIAELERKIREMNPMPKWMGVLSILGAIASALAGMADILPPKYAAIASTLATLLAALSHSLPGTGGKPKA